VSASAGGAKGHVAIMHPFMPVGRYVIDGATQASRRPAVFELTEGRHIVAFRTTVPTFPEQVVVHVTAGDTIRATFLPMQGGGPRGDSMRAQLRERLRRTGGVLGDDGRGGGMRRGRGGRQNQPPVRGDTL
jgi:hypothetical protein